MNWKELPPARKLDGISLGESRQSSFRSFAIVRQRFDCRREHLSGSLSPSNQIVPF